MDELTFIAGSGIAIPPGTPPGFAWRRNGLYRLEEGGGGAAHLFIAPPFEITGWDSTGRPILRSPRSDATVAVNPGARPAPLRHSMTLIGCCPPAGQNRIHHLGSYLSQVSKPTGQLWKKAA